SGRIWHHRIGPQTNYPERFGGRGERFIHQLLRGRIGVLDELPRGALDDELVYYRNEAPNSFQPFREIKFIEGFQRLLGGLSRRFGDVSRAVGSRNFTLPILVHHGERPAGQVSQTIRKIRVVALDQGVVAEASILAKGDL